MRLRLTVSVLALWMGVALTAPPATAQGLAAVSAATSSIASMTMEKTGAGCWGCAQTMGMGTCIGGQVPGYFNCFISGMRCNVSSPGCGAGAQLPLDPDGSSQYVSRGSKLGIPVTAEDGQLAVRRNCEGVVVARAQTLADIGVVRTRTGTLTL